MNSNDKNGTKGKFFATIDGKLVNLKPNLYWQGETCTIHGTTIDDGSDQYYTLRINFPTTLTGRHEFGKDGLTGLALLMSTGGPSIAGGWIKGGHFTLGKSNPRTANFEGVFAGVAGSREEGDTLLEIKDGVFDLQGISQGALPEVAEPTRHQKQKS
ncbi:hypothetical protein [Pseudomonas lini]